MRVKIDLDGQCAQHLTVNLNRGIGSAFHSHPVRRFDMHIGIEPDKPAGKSGKLPQPDERITAHEAQHEESRLREAGLAA